MRHIGTALLVSLGLCLVTVSAHAEKVTPPLSQVVIRLRNITQCDVTGTPAKHSFVKGDASYTVTYTCGTGRQSLLTITRYKASTGLVDTLTQVDGGIPFITTFSLRTRAHRLLRFHAGNATHLISEVLDYLRSYSTSDSSECDTDPTTHREPGDRLTHGGCSTKTIPIHYRFTTGAAMNGWFFVSP